MNGYFLVGDRYIDYCWVPSTMQEIFNEAQKIYDEEKQNNLMKCDMPSSKNPRTYTL